MRNNKQKLAVVIALVMAVVGLSIGFAVFSSTLNIQSRASVNPTNNFNVKFASSISTTDQGLTYQDNTENYPVSKSATGNSTASNATIDNTLEYPTISNLNATFTQPGESVQYTFYVVNVGEYDAYLTNLVFNNAQGSSTFKDCVANASSDNPASNASSVCNNINLSVKLGNENPVQETTTFNNHLLEKNNFETVIVTISYTGEIYADGEVNVSFGDIELHYSTVDEPIQIATSEVSPIDDANYLYTYIYDAPVTYTISENCESLLINEAELSTSDAASLCSGTVNNLILNVFHVDEENLAYPYAVSLAAALGGLD